ncbi:MAG: RNA polymerase sigma factor RpoD/SigA [Fibrobacteres bacterium]|nr:RNA polymerase sigma factor RpoD/SigA [Fibrobacterota bacterium]
MAIEDDTQAYIERLYYKELGRHKVLTDAEEKVLVGKLQSGDRLAINTLILGNLRFVVSIARKYQNRGLTLLEVINEGNLGLYKAAKRFNVDKDVKFTSYAVWWVRQSIQKAIFDQATVVKIPPNKIALIRKFKYSLAKLNGNMDEALNLADYKPYASEIVDILEKLNPFSLDAPVSNDADEDSVHTLLDVLGVEAKQEDDLERKELKKVLNAILAKMTKREETVLRMYYSIDHDKEFTLEEIGEKLSLTRERVRQIKNKALRKLFHSKELREHLKSVPPDGTEPDYE